jgi:hypothetical protein
LEERRKTLERRREHCPVAVERRERRDRRRGRGAPWDGEPTARLFQRLDDHFSGFRDLGTGPDAELAAAQDVLLTLEARVAAMERRLASLTGPDTPAARREAG